MFDGLCCADQPGIDGRRSLELLDDLSAFLGETIDGRAGIPLRLFVNPREDFLQAFDVPFGLVAMLFEGSPEIVAFRGLCELRERREDLLFREVGILQRIMEKVF
jgi:hypothetical protein